MRVGLLTGGGDAPGLNAAIRAVVRSAVDRDMEIIGIEDGFRGLIEPGHARPLTPLDVDAILRQGGTILGTTNRANPMRYPQPDGSTRDESGHALDRAAALGLDALITIGGDGTLAIASALHQRGLRVVAIPKTIDNDVAGTLATIGSDSAVAIATDAIDRLHTTAESHHRVMVVEVMGRYAGWIALGAGLAGGADVILIPELPYDLALVAQSIRRRETAGAAGFSVVVAAEGARPIGGRYTVIAPGSATAVERLGGVGAALAIELERLTGKEARCVQLGHLQRGGDPTSADRILATRFGTQAVEFVAAGRFGIMCASHPPDITAVPLASVVGVTKTVPEDSDLLRSARAIGISFGDAAACGHRDRIPAPARSAEAASAAPSR